MAPFVDPRTKPKPGPRPSANTTDDPAELEPLIDLCLGGRIYEIEDWIRAGRPLQVSERVKPVRHRRTPLSAAIEDRHYSLVLLLLCNGYDMSKEARSPVDLALDARAFDILKLLLEWGADPLAIDLEHLFGSYSIKLFDLFLDLGLDFTRDHALARALGEHSSNKPLYGFVKRRRAEYPEFQRELDIALAAQVADGTEKGVLLCLWAGADPHASVPMLRYIHLDDPEELTTTAIEEACWRGNDAALNRFGPDPKKDDFDRLLESVRSPKAAALLAKMKLPSDMGQVIERHVASLNHGWSSIATIEAIFEAGARWRTSSKKQIAEIRRLILAASDPKSNYAGLRHSFSDLMRLLAKADFCADEILQELGRTPAMKARFDEAGLGPHSFKAKPVRERFGMTPPPTKKPVQTEPWIPRVVRIGRYRPGTSKVVFTRGEVYDQVWSEPLMSLAEKWGLSGVGLAKACKRIGIPVPPRGYWQKHHAGKQQRRAALKALKEGVAEKIEVFVLTDPAV